MLMTSEGIIIFSQQISIHTAHMTTRACNGLPQGEILSCLLACMFTDPRICRWSRLIVSLPRAIQRSAGWNRVLSFMNLVQSIYCWNGSRPPSRMGLQVASSQLFLLPKMPLSRSHIIRPLYYSSDASRARELSSNCPEFHHHCRGVLVT